VAKILDSDGKWVRAGCTILFSYGIPPTSVKAPVIRRGAKLIVLTEGHNPSECPLRELRGHVGDFWVIKEPDLSLPANNGTGSGDHGTGGSMKKIPTIFERDWNGDRSRVVDKINPKAQWVFDGEGWPTRKLDGTSCMIRDGKLFKRREFRSGSKTPFDFIVCDRDDETGKTVGWVPVGDSKEDKWHREAFVSMPNHPDGTYELVGPKVQGDPEGYGYHCLVPHDQKSLVIDESRLTRSFDGLKAFLSKNGFEGIVFHHADGRMAKIKARDFGIKRPGGLNGKQGGEKIR